MHAEPHALVQHAERAQVERAVAERDQQQLGQDAHLPPLAHAQDGPRDGHQQREIEREIEQRRDVRVDVHETRDARRHPQREQRGQRRARGGGLAGPVARRGQQEAGDHGGAVAVDHLVGVPQARVGAESRQGETEGEARHPDHHGQAAVDHGAEEEGPKARLPQRRTAVCGYRRGGGNGRGRRAGHGPWYAQRSRAVTTD